MKESYTPGGPENLSDQAKLREREFKKNYQQRPAAEPRLFASSENLDEESFESPFVFPPINMSVTEEVVTNLIECDRFTEFELKYIKLEKRLEKLLNDESVLGDFEVSCCMRTEGETQGRVDKMIAELDGDDSWQPGRLEHLLTLAASHPEVFDGPVVALGSEIKQTANVPCMQNKNGRIEYTEYSNVGSFGSHFQFLIVRRT